MKFDLQWYINRRSMNDEGLKRPDMVLNYVFSGGQTGVDRAALDAALASGLEIGGWCPPGRVSEEGAIPFLYPLRETPSEHSPDAPGIPRSLRTEWNVRDADATLIILPQLPATEPGTAWSISCAERYGKPCLIADPFADDAVTTVLHWLQNQPVRTLNIAGPSEHTCPGIYQSTLNLLKEVFTIQK